MLWLGRTGALGAMGEWGNASADQAGTTIKPQHPNQLELLCAALFPQTAEGVLDLLQRDNS